MSITLGGELLPEPQFLEHLLLGERMGQGAKVLGTFTPKERKFLRSKSSKE